MVKDLRLSVESWQGPTHWRWVLSGPDGRALAEHDQDADGWVRSRPSSTAEFPELAGAAAALLRILDGERDPAALTADLDPIGRAAVINLLTHLPPRPDTRPEEAT